MESNLFPSPHRDPWLDLLRPYVSEVVRQLLAAGTGVHSSWLDPRDPRDATIVFRGLGTTASALVWDEESGWRTGVFVTGHQGVRTVLGTVGYLGGCLIPAPAEVAGLVTALRPPLAVGRPLYRSYRDLGDGTDEALRAYDRSLCPA